MHKTRALIALAFGALLAAAFVAAGCGGDDNDTSGGGGDLNLLKPGTLTVGTDWPYPPFETGKAQSTTGDSTSR